MRAPDEADFDGVLGRCHRPERGYLCSVHNGVLPIDPAREKCYERRWLEICVWRMLNRLGYPMPEHRCCPHCGDRHPTPCAVCDTE